MLDYIFSWNTLFWLVLVLYIPACIGLVVVVLLQKGKGVGFAGAFGTGAGTEAVFGPRTSRSLPQRITYTMAGLFMGLALVLSLLSGRVGRGAAPALLDPAAAVAPSEELDSLFEGEAPATTPAADGITVTPTVDGNAVTIPPADTVNPGGETVVTTPVEVTPMEAAPAEAPADAPAEAAPAVEEAAPAAEAPAEAAPVEEAAPAEEAPAATEEPAPAAQ